MADTISAEEIKKEGSLLKQLYFWSFIAFGMIAPFAGIFYKKVLVTPEGEPDVKLIGIIFSLAPIMGVVANIATGVLSDRLKKGRHIISWLSIVGFVTALFVGFGGSPFLMGLSLHRRFLYMLFAVLLYRFTMMPINALLDSETMQFLSKHGDRNQYGTYRFWGTIGWAVATPVMGAILWYFGNYQLIFYVGGIAYLMFAYLGMRSSGKATVKKMSIPWRYINNDERFASFLLFALLAGIVDNSTSTYIGFFFDDVMTTPLRIGIIFSVWTTLEIPVMKYSKQLITRFGNRGLIGLGLLLQAVKLTMFSFFTLETPFYFQVLAALIHGPAFAFLFLGMVDIVDRMAHEDMRATYMSVTSIARYTLASVIGGMLGALLIDFFGGALFMRIGAVAMALLIPFFFLIVKKETKNDEKTFDNEKAV